MSTLFTFQSDRDRFYKSDSFDFGNDLGIEDSSAYYAEPTGGAINVVKDFKWTKTLKNGRMDVPTLYLKEYYLTNPAFLSNISNVFDDLVEVGVEAVGTLSDLVIDATQSDESQNNFALQNAKKIVGDFFGGTGGEGQNIINRNAGLFANNTGRSGVPITQSYLNAYRDIYGLAESRFTYYLPYFVKDWKTTNTSWGKNDLGLESLFKQDVALGVSLRDVFTFLSTGFGVDFAKMYNYPGNKGNSLPSTTVTFQLDNTYDSQFDDNPNQLSSYQKNWELIFLLLYQNLPNKRNRLFLDPPVLYRSRVRGVFSYLYSYISKLAVESVGNRRERDLYTNINGQIQQIKTVIPEAFNVQLTLQSLTPETRNLMLDSLLTKVTTSEQ